MDACVWATAVAWVRTGAAVLLSLSLGARSAQADAVQATPQAPPSAQQRYDAARWLMQHGNFVEAADAFRGVADAEDASPSLRAQALSLSTLAFCASWRLSSRACIDHVRPAMPLDIAKVGIAGHDGASGGCG